MSTQASSAQPGQYAKANGINIYYDQHGSGEPLLLLHGGVVSHSMWEKHIPIFAQHYTVIAPDSRGHGRTKNPLDTMSYRLLADDMAAFIRALGLDRPLVCGYSDGGQIALEMGMNYPQLAKAYVIGAASFKWTEPYFQFVKAFGMEGPGVVDFEQLERGAPWAVPMMRANHDEFQGHDYWKTYVTQLSKMWLAPLNYSSGELEKIGEPCLILVGDRDNLALPAEQAVELYRMIPHAELAIVPGADHGYPESKPELFTQLVLDFLLRQSVRSNVVGLTT
jgi:pimeloyl-ACP methyl ester carboxylesterase